MGEDKDESSRVLDGLLEIGNGNDIVAKLNIRPTNWDVTLFKGWNKEIDMSKVE